MKTIFTERLSRVMFMKGIRQTDLIERTGIDKGSMSSYVNGRYKPSAENVSKIAAALGVTVDYLLGREDMPIARLSLSAIREVPVLGDVAAGVPIAAQEDVVGSVLTDKDVFALRIHGDSMSPRIMDGDIVLVRQQNYAEDGDIVIALIDGDATCKMFKKTHGIIKLVPFNATFAPFVYSGDEIDELKILGKVVESRHEW